MNKLIIATSISLALTLTVGCTNKSVVRYGDVTAVETTDTNFD